MEYPKVKANSVEMHKELKAVFEKYGWKMTEIKGKLSSDGLELNYAIALKELSLSTENKTPAQVRYEQRYQMYGLPADGLGKHFTNQGTLYRIVGLSDINSESVLLGQNARGKRYRFKPRDIIPRIY